MKTIVTSFLTSIFDEYINPIQGYQLDVALWQGNAQLQNVTIKPTALSTHDFPFTVTSGTIKLIKLHFPWSSMNSMPCEIQIEGINIVAEFTKDVQPKSDIELKQHILKDLEEACQVDEENKDGIFSGIFTTIVDNIIFTIKDIHIKVELNVPQVNICYLYGLILDEVECYTINDKGEKAFVNSSNLRLRKQLHVKGLSLYIDQGPIPTPTTTAMVSTNHHYLINSLSFSFLFVRTRNDKSSQTEITNKILSLSFQFNQEQLIALSEFQYQANMFNLRCKYFNCGHPLSHPKSQRSSGKWWRYIHRCTIEKRYPNRLKIDAALQMLDTRHTYYQLWEKRQSMPYDEFKKTDYYNLLQNVDESLDLNTILILRSYSEFKMKTKNGNKDNLHHEIIQFDPNELSKLLSETSSVSTFLISLSIDQITTNLMKQYGDSQPQISLGAYSVNGLFSKSFERNTVFSIDCRLFKIFTPNVILFQQGEEDKKVASNESGFTFSYRTFPKKEETELDVNAMSPRIFIDLDLIESLKQTFVENGIFANPSSKFSFVPTQSAKKIITQTIDNALHQDVATEIVSEQPVAVQTTGKEVNQNLILQKKLEETKFLKINIKCASPKIKLAKTNLSLKMNEISINSFPMHDRVYYKEETLYKNYEFLLRELSIHLDNDIILKPVSTNVKFASIIAPVVHLDRFKVSINMSSVSMNLSKHSYQELINTFRSLTSANKKETNSIPNDEIDLQSLMKDLKSSLSINIQQISLNLVSLGEFKIINFNSSFILESNSIATDFTLGDIKCNSTDKQYIEFNSSKQINNKAIVGSFSISSGNPTKSEISLNSPKIILDFALIQQAIQFFSIESNQKASISNEQTITTTSNNIDKKSVINLNLSKPILILLIPSIKKDKIEFSFQLDSITFNTNEGKLLFDNLILFQNDRQMLKNTSISYLLSQSKVESKSIDVLLQEYDYPLLMELFDYLISMYDKYLNDGTSGNTKIHFDAFHVTFENTFSFDSECFNIELQKTMNMGMSNLLLTNLMNDTTPFFTSSTFSLLKENDNISICLAASTNINAHLDLTHFLYDYFVERKFENRIDFVHQQRTVPLTVKLYTTSINLQLEELSNATSETIEINIEHMPNNTKISLEGKNIILAESKYIPIQSQKEDNNLIVLDNDISSSNQYFLTADFYSFSFESSTIALKVNSAKLNLDYNEIMDYSDFVSVILSGFPDGVVKPITVPSLLYNIAINDLFVNLNHSTLSLDLKQVSLTNSEMWRLNLIANSINAYSTIGKINFAMIQKLFVCIDMNIKDVSPPVDNQNNQSQIAPNSNNSSNPFNTFNKTNQSPLIKQTTESLIDLNDEPINTNSILIENNQQSNSLVSANEYESNTLQMNANPFNTIKTNSKQTLSNPSNQIQLSNQNISSSENLIDFSDANIQPTKANSPIDDIFNSPTIESNHEKVNKTKETEEKNYLHGITFTLNFDSLNLQHQYEFVCDFCDALNYLFKCITKRNALSNRYLKTKQLKNNISYQFNVNFGFNIKDFLLCFNNNTNISLTSFKFSVEDSNKFVEIGTISCSQNQFIQCKKTPFLKMSIQTNLMTVNLNVCQVRIDLNSYFLNKLFLTIINSPIFTKLSLGDDNNNQSVEFYDINLQKAQVVLINDNMSLFFDLSSLQYILSESIFLIHFQDIRISFAENSIQCEPIMKNFSIGFERAGSDLRIILENAVISISPSDLFDFKSFYAKSMKFVNNLAHKLLTNTSTKPKNEINSLVFDHSDLILLLCEDNRTTIVPFPFIRLKINRNSFCTPIDNNIKVCFPCLELEMFNQNTQKWDILFEPLSLQLSVQNKTLIGVTVTSGMQLVASMQNILQLIDFKFERKPFVDNHTIPSYILENNTNQLIQLVFNDNSKMSISGQNQLDLFKTDPFRLGKRNIDPQNFFSPQFIGNNYLLSLFRKKNKRFLSINSLILIRNRGNIPLVYQDLKNNIMRIEPNSITPISVITKKFVIFGDNPFTTPQVMNLKDVKEQGKLLIPVIIGKQTYKYIITYKLSMKRGVVILVLTPHYTIFNHLKIPIEFVVKQPLSRVTIEPKSKNFLNDSGFSQHIQFYIKAYNLNTHITTLDFTENHTIPVKFTENSALSLLYNDNLISIKPPLIFQNRTDNTITIFDCNGSSLGDVMHHTEIFVGTPDYFFDQRISLSFAIEGYKRSMKFQIENTRQDIFMESTIFEDLFYPLVWNMTFGTSGIFHFNINSLIKVKNETSTLISLQSLNNRNEIYGPALCIDVGQMKPIMFASKLLVFRVSVENSKSCATISLKIDSDIGLPNEETTATIHSTLLLSETNSTESQPYLLEVDFKRSDDNTCYYVVFKDVKFPQPLMITNLLGEENESLQRTILLPNNRSVLPLSTTYIASHSINDKKLVVYCYDKQFIVDLNSIDTPCGTTVEYAENNMKKEITVFHEIHDLPNNCHLLVFSTRRVIHQSTNSILSFDGFNVIFEIPSFSISLIDDKMRELALFVLNNATFNFHRNQKMDTLSFVIDNIQIDDMYPDAPIPVVAFNSVTPFITMNVSRMTHATNAYKQFLLSINDMTLYLDLNFISEMVYFFKTMVIKQRQLSRPEYTTGAINDHSTATDSSIMTIEVMKIDSFNFNLNIASHTGRPTLHLFESDILPNFIPLISDLKVNLPLFNKENMIMTKNQFMNIIYDHYKEGLRSIICKFLLPSPEGIFKAVSSLCHQINTTTINTGPSIRHMHQKSGQTLENQVKKSGTPISFNKGSDNSIKEGFHSFGNGLVKAFTGIVTQPIEGFHEKGASGLFGGIVKGVAGVVLSPAAGIIDAATGIIDGVKNSGNTVREPIRFPRTISNHGQIVRYDQQSSICQIIFQRFVKDYNEFFVFYIKERTRFIAISINYFVIFETNKTFVSNDKKVRSSTSQIDVQQSSQSKNYPMKSSNSVQTLDRHRPKNNDDSGLNSNTKPYVITKIRKISDIENVLADTILLKITFKDKSVEFVQCPNENIASNAENIIYPLICFNKLLT